ncbi:hypothetical protein AVEN_5061-1 [Araneus ventricosus]|uniref:HAT C-terminal dimerisation domain-containing protein n=1 Tax=Araneus ventricosus TaxID=182803 RepID=A0A4Y2PHI7_ARAVE|nr:hypothetical protein AVEN_5061-1 [Araneus ventricosus]
MEICEVLNIKYTMPQNYISFRWLSVYVVAQDFSRMISALTLFYFSFLSRSEKTNFLPVVINIYKLHNVTEAGKEFIHKMHSRLAEKNMTQAGKDRKSRIAEKLFENSLTTKLITNLLVSVLPLLQEYVKLFESGTPLIHKLHDKQFELIKSFLGCFMKPEVLASLGDSTKKMMGLDIKKKCYHLPISSVFVGVKAKELIASAPKSQYDKIKSFTNNIMKAYVACSEALQKKMPIDNVFLKCMSSVDPMCRKNSLALELMKKLPQLVTNILLPKEKELFDLEVRKYHVDSLYTVNEGVSIDEWWVEVKKTGKYPLLSKMVCALLTCFHCPKVESSFSVMNNIISASSTRMNILPFSAIQSIKYHLFAENKTSVAYFAKKDFLHEHVEKKLVENLRSSCRAYQDEKNKKMEQKQKQINKLHKQKEKLLSKEAARKLCANAAKKQRIRHKKNILKIKDKTNDLPRHSRDNVVPTTMSGIKQIDTNEDCVKTLASTENKHAEDANTSFIEEKSVKDRSPPKQGVKRVNGDLLPTKATQIKKRKETTSLTIKEMFQRVRNNNAK